MNVELEVLMTRQGFVFSPSQAEAAGLTREQRRVLIRSGVLREIRHGICTTTERWELEDHGGRHRINLAGALLIRGWSPDATLHRHVGGLRSAAYLLGLPFQPDAAVVAALEDGGDPRALSAEARALRDEVAAIRRGEGPRHIDLVSTHRRRTYAHGVHVRPATLPSDQVALDAGVPVTSLARTAVDLMREGSVPDALIAADGALHLGLRRTELERVAHFCARWSNGHQALMAVGFADGRAESAAESLARWVCAQEEKLPEPELQVDLYDAAGHIGRVDLLFRRFRVVLEVDGYIKYTDPWCGDAQEALREQHAREARLRLAGWIVVRTTWHELVHDPAGFIGRLWAAFDAAR